MKSNKIRRNIPLMYAITFFQSIVIYAAIATLYRQARGITLAEFAVIEGFSYIFQLAFEIPFGMLADRFGYRRTLLFSNGIYLLSKVVFWQAFGFSAFLLERLFFSMALAGLSGVSESILFLSCNQQDSQKVFSYHNASGTAGMLTGSLIFTLFLSTNYDAAALGTVLAYTIAFFLSFFVTDVVDMEKKDPQLSPNHLLSTLKVSLKDRKFLLFILGMTLVDYATWAARIMLGQPRFLSLGMTEQHICVFEIVLSLLAMTGISSAALTKKLGFKKTMVLGISTVALSALVFGLTRHVVPAIFSCALIEIAYDLIMPLVSDLYSKRVTVSDRATQLSVYAMIGELFSFGISFVMSAVTSISEAGGFLLCAGMAALGIFFFLHCYHGVRNMDVCA